MDKAIDIIGERTSVRSYTGERLSAVERARVERILAEAGVGPFGGRPRFRLEAASAEDRAEARPIGAYGMIRKAPAFVVGAIRKGEVANEDYGYVLERVILEITALGLGTCWLGGSFDRGESARRIGLGGDEMIPAVTPVGRKPASPGIRSRAIRAAVGADRRKPWAVLFFDESWESPLILDPGSPWKAALECLRLAPSASNKQPWRLVRRTDGGPSFHLYLYEDKAYNLAYGEVRMQDVDMGIAMAHLELAARSLDLGGAWTRLPQAPISAPPPLRYIASWR